MARIGESCNSDRSVPILGLRAPVPLVGRLQGTHPIQGSITLGTGCVRLAWGRRMPLVSPGSLTGEHAWCSGAQLATV